MLQWLCSFFKSVTARAKVLPAIIITLWLSGATAQTPVVKIMAVGDSLTEGIDDLGGYRPHLYQLLKLVNLQFQFVGSQTDNPLGIEGLAYEGHSGYRIDQIEEGLLEHIATYRPQIILLGAGGNDITQNYDPEHAPERLVSLVQSIHQSFPEVVVFVQTRPPRLDAINSKILIFNEKLRQLIRAYSAQNTNLILVDNEKIFTADPAYISEDQIHPSQRGYRRLAYSWFAAVYKYWPKSWPKN